MTDSPEFHESHRLPEQAGVYLLSVQAPKMYADYRQIFREILADQHGVEPIEELTSFIPFKPLKKPLELRCLGNDEASLRSMYYADFESLEDPGVRGPLLQINLDLFKDDKTYMSPIDTQEEQSNLYALFIGSEMAPTIVSFVHTEGIITAETWQAANKHMPGHEDCMRILEFLEGQEPDVDIAAYDERELRPIQHEG